MDKEQKYLMNQLAEETFAKDVDEFSYKRVEALVQLMEVNEQTDPEEVEDAHKEFEKKFRQMTARKRRINVQKLARIAAVICILVFGANLTTEALMDDNVFHVIQRWGNRYSLLPSDNDLPHEEFETIIFEDIESFDESFDDDFLVASWMPDGYQLKYIKCVEGDLNYYLWCYSNQEHQRIYIRIYKKTNENLGSLIGTDLSKFEHISLHNNRKIQLCQNNDEYIACFEYGTWWYIVQSNNKDNLINIMEGMSIYE